MTKEIIKHYKKLYEYYKKKYGAYALKCRIYFGRKIRLTMRKQPLGNSALAMP